ncbi:glycosyltransferase [Thermofilum sp.]|uniref:glycosyltransferase n=1 Tax=Thermofilum sp. TaxID=1961369 RepID=UPI00315F4D92
MRLLVITNGIWYSGAQVATNEFMSFLAKLNNVEIKVVSCLGGKYVLSTDNVEIYRVPCWNVGALLQMKPDSIFEQLVRWADAIWIATGEFAVAKWVKRIKMLPVVAHLHSYEPICPNMWFSYGFNGVCGRKCSPLLLTRCKQSTHRIFAEISGTWVEALARRYGVGRRVRFLNKLDDEKYFNLMAGARATVMPSVWPETFGVVAVESISLGVPVVGSNMGGIPEVVGGYGVVVPLQPEEIVEGILKVLGETYNRDEMREYALSKFGFKNVELFLRIVERLI